MRRKRQKEKRKAKIRQANALFLKSYYSRNKKTLLQACKAVIFGALFIAGGFAMTVLGYFDRELATDIVYNSTINSETNQTDPAKRMFFKSMQYVGPILMGFGAISLIIACVMTLESRDKHAQIIQEESNDLRRIRLEKESTKTSLLSPYEDEKDHPANKNNDIESNNKTVTINEKRLSIPASIQPVELDVQKILVFNTRKPRGNAPIVEADSISDLQAILPQSQHLD